MGNNFHSINAKIGVLRKGILKESDYEKILSFEQRHEIVDYLKNNPLYKYEIPLYEERSMRNRYDTEFMLNKIEADLLGKLKYFLFSDDKKIIEVMLMKYEFKDIKIILRSIVENEKIDLERDTIMYKKNKHIDYDKLVNCETFHQALEVLNGTIYKKAIASLTDEDVFRLHFHVEMKLDSLYFLSMKKAIDKLSKSSQNILSDYFSALIDTINLQWIIRAKKYYNLSNEEIYSYSLRFGKYIKGDFLKDLIYSDSIEAIVEKIKKTKLRYTLEDENGNAIVSNRNIKEYVYISHLKKLKDYDNSISTLLKFIIQLNVQNENLIRIAEANKYQLGKNEVKKYLINIH
ncbi:V-type ATPase subunit [uncultured Parvimonas sp.]|uniref:V-type ATPase subunit n=1 Tax=uncultured Parvimonas sp. TaxID=747372 RepID=UPI00259573DF|nr:V-type ATPase subunit [uncultured Parvimonas sp.]